MNEEKFGRSYLETLSFADLTKLADEHGIEVPENLNRNFLIGELLEIEEERENPSEENMIIEDADQAENSEALPLNYNETQICCILRNPVWAFVFWNISDSDKSKLKSIRDCSLMIRVCVLSSKEDLNPVEAFEIQAASESGKNGEEPANEQYVLLPAGKRFFRFELVYKSAASAKVLAFSSVVEIPEGADYLNDLQPGNIPEFSNIAKISGIEKIVMKQYKNHRHSF